MRACRRQPVSARGLLALLLVLATAPAAAAQFLSGSDLACRSAYVWRGHVLASSVLQPAVFVALERKSFIGTAGVWTSIDMGRSGGEAEGFGRRWFGETNLWAEISGEFGPLQAAIGAVGYLIENDRAFGPAEHRVDTYEIYARAFYTRTRINPRLTVWHDPYRVKGTYVDGGLTWRIPGWNYVILPLGSLLASVEGGYNFDQGRDPSQEQEPFYFAEDGALTHVAFSVATIGRAEVGPFRVVIQPEMRVVYRNAAVRNLSVDGRKWLRPGWAFTISIVTRCDPGREICRQF